MTVPFVVVADFDGTLTKEDLVVALTTHVEPSNQSLVDEINRREVGLHDGLTRLFATLPSDQRDRYETFVAGHGKLRSGTVELLAALERWGAPFYVVSNGLDFMLKPVLRDLVPESHIIANHARFDSKHVTIDWRYPCAPPCPGGCGLCKHHVVREMRQKYPSRPLVFIGDGVTDINGALASDVVYARAHLAHYLDEMGRPFTPFDSMTDVLSHLATRKELAT